MSPVESVRITWQVDHQVPKKSSDLEIAKQVAEAYFQDRIAKGEADTACVFTVMRDGHTSQVDLSERLTEVQVLARAAKKVLDQYQQLSDSGDAGSLRIEDRSDVIVLRRLIDEAEES